jgi:hypothetical protein
MESVFAQNKKDTGEIQCPYLLLAVPFPLFRFVSLSITVHTFNRVTPVSSRENLKVDITSHAPMEQPQASFRAARVSS